jgi:hypothetical protein
MAELQRAVGVKLELIEALVKKHFGPEYTSRITWNFTKGRYVPSTLPRRIATPQKVLGFQIGWRVIGEFSDNLGFRLEIWDPTFLRQAEDLVEEYNKNTDGTKLELHPFFMLGTTPGRHPAVSSKP